VQEFPGDIGKLHLHLDGLGAVVGRFHHLHRLVILHPEEENGHDQAGDGKDAEGVAPAERFGNHTAQNDADGRAHRNGSRKKAVHGGPLFFREIGGDHGMAAGSISRLARAQHGAHREKLGEVPGEGAGGRANAPEHGHDADGLLPAPPVHQQGHGKNKHRHHQGHDGGEPAALGVGQSPVCLQIGKDRRHNHPVHVIEQVQEEEQQEYIVRVAF